ncbi:hypothetical protein OV203_30095 [Nannocystis sp. ILAH1]|uniref:hypothetical protein n=1 Tax=Nannocystis sp. ILAH1 TaxID=2996789 RepID=UPI00226EF56A|nr:hypothetical protein [Nannocystis sp. ILAH1]MCY0991436.1 hypothetical protein [Nannocystis sp. ILAH1]
MGSARRLVLRDGAGRVAAREASAARCDRTSHVANAVLCRRAGRWGIFADAADGRRSGRLGIARNFAEEAVTQAVLDLAGAYARKVIRVTTEELAHRVDLGGGGGP